MKALLAVVALVILAVGAFSLWSPGDMKSDNVLPVKEESEMKTEVAGERSEVSDGMYAVLTEQSKVNWAGKKPLLEGYINNGSLAVAAGQINMVNGAVTGSFVIDMDTLSVSNTPTKPGKESTLEGHLKSDTWFDVENFPEATFVITQAAMGNDKDLGGNYVITGDLTMKGQTHEVGFPADVYLNADGNLVAVANFEFDRTKWGITSGSGSFFDNLADNVIDDMVALSFTLVAARQ